MKNYLIGLLLILTVSLFYFSFFGEKSIFSLFKLNAELEKKKEKLDLLKTESNNLSNSIKKLEIETLDLDYVDEIARDKHNLSEPNEVIIFNKKEKKKEKKKE